MAEIFTEMSESQSSRVFDGLCSTAASWYTDSFEALAVSTCRSKERARLGS